MTKQNLAMLLHQILQHSKASSQSDLQDALRKKGVVVTQPSISRALMKIGAVKSKLPDGQIVYRLTDALQVERQLSMSDLIHHIVANENMVVVHTKISAAQMVGQWLDEADLKNVIGTLAGDDTILVIPDSIKNTNKVLRSVKQVLGVL